MPALVKEREKDWQGKQGRVDRNGARCHRRCRAEEWIDDFAGDGGIDHFVANVSALGTENTAEGWRKAIDIDLVATVNAVLHVRPHLETRGKGATLTIIGTTSLVEISGPTAPYRSVKAALVPMVKSIAIEVAPKGVRANMVSPGTILEDGNTWGRQRDAGAERYTAHAGAQPDGPHGHTAGGGGRRRVPRRRARPRSSAASTSSSTAP